MRRIIVLIMIFSIVFCACAKKENESTVSGSAVSSTATESSVSDDTAGKERQLEDDPDMTVIMARNNRPMLSKKVDQTKKGIEIICNTEFATGPVKGVDGDCYYYRRERKKGGRITFYRNNAVKVCETVLPEKYEKNYYITTFVKQGGRFWIQLISYESNQEYLVPVQIKDGKWGKKIKIEGERIIYYKGSFYSFYKNQGAIYIIDQSGNKKVLKIEKDEKPATLQIIIDDKLYYIIENSDSDRYYSVKRCNMDGSHKEELFRYNGVSSTNMNHCRLSMDGDFLYLFDPYCGFTLTRIPLYGGKVEKIVAADWYELTEDSIYYLDEAGKISRINKDLKGGPEFIIQENKELMGKTFFCTDGHLLVEIYNETELDKLRTIWKAGSGKDSYDISMNYSNEYHWIKENGKAKDIIPGSGFDRDYQRWYEIYQEWGDGEDEYEE